MYRVGIAGCGSITKFRHAPEYRQNPQAEIAGFYDYKTERANEMAETFGGKVYPTYEEMLNDPSIDAVSICTANAFHCRMTVQALKAGKHVLCEKPMALTKEETREMVDEAGKQNRILMIGHNQRLVSAHQMARKLIGQGELGKILTFRTTFCHAGPESWSADKSKSTWFFQKGAAGLGSLADLGIHKVDLIRWLLQSEVKEVTSALFTEDKRYEDGSLIEIDDNSISVLKMENGAVGSVTTGWTNYGEEDNSTVIYGTKGVMKIFSDPRYAVTIQKKDGTVVNYQMDAIQTNTSQTSSGVIDLFLESIGQGAALELSGEEAAKVMDVIFAMEQSAKEKRTVSLGQGDEK